MEIKIGDSFKGKDCHNELISGKIYKLLTNTIIVEDGVNRYIIRKSELTAQGQVFPESPKKKNFNHRL